MYISEIADELGYDIAGEDCKIEGITWFDTASENDIAVVKSKDDILSTKARAVLTKPVLVQTDKTLLIVFDSIECALAKVGCLLVKNKIIADYSVPTEYALTDKGYYVGKNSKIGVDTTIQPGAMIGDNVTIGDNCVIEPFALVDSGTVIGRDVHIGSGSKVGVASFYHYYVDGQINQFCGCGIVKIADNTRVGCNTIIQRGTISNTEIGANCMIGNCIDIGHDVKIGDNCKIVSQTGIAGNTSIKNNVLIYGQAGIANNLVIGNNAVIKAKTVVSRSVHDNEVVYGPYGRNYSKEMRLIGKIRNFFEGKDE